VATENDLRERTLRLLRSPSAFQVELTFDRYYFSGAYFAAVIGAIQRKAAGGKGIGFRVGQVEDDADAQYDPAANVIDVRGYDYGTTAGDRDSLIHECFHAWRDIMGARLRTINGGYVSTTALTDEAMAYLVGALFTNYATTPPRGSVRAPSWASAGVYAEAHRVALPLTWAKTPVVPYHDARCLKDKIRCSPTYRGLRAWTRYGNNGV
jgi:hypothetical protein